MSRKRRRGDTGVDAQVVGIYEDLANENDEVRLKAAHALLSRVLPDKNPSNEELQTIMKRLFRGLCSSRKAARLGFSVALTEFLVHGSSRSQLSDQAQDITAIIDTLEQQTRILGGVSGQEERDHYFGRLFGAEAIIQSGILSFWKSSIIHLERLLDLVYELAKKKSWLREECGWILCTALRSPMPMSLDHAQVYVDKLHASGLNKTPEGLALWITARSVYPGIKFPKHIWHHEDPLHRKETASLARILNETTTHESVVVKKKDIQRGNWTARLHFAWDIVFKSLLKDPQKQVSPSQLWRKAVDDGLFAISSSDERKYWGFLLFQKYVAEYPEDQIIDLFGPNFRRCLVNQLSSTERFLHSAAEKSLRALHLRIENQSGAAVSVIGVFADCNLSNFDILTKTKTIEKIISQANLQALANIIPVFIRVILKPDAHDERAVTASRQLNVDHLVSALRSRAFPSESESAVSLYNSCVSLITNFFVKHAYFKHISVVDNVWVPDPPLSITSREMLQSRLTSCLSILVLKSDNPAYFPHQVLSYIRAYETRDQEFRSWTTFESNSNITEAIRKGWKTIDWLDEEESNAGASRMDFLRAFKLLYTLTILQIYNGDADAVGIIHDLQRCFKTLSDPRSRINQGPDSETLVEIILSLVSRPSLLFKRLAHQVFSVCTLVVNASGLQSMIKVLETRETISGQQEVFEQDDSDVSLSDAEMLDVERIDDEKTDAVAIPAGIDDTSVTLDSDDSSVDEPDIDNNLDNSDSSDKSEETDDELAQFDAKLAQALHTRQLDREQATNAEESSDEDMNDDEMEALDAQLETVFQERKKLTSKKTEKKEAKETIVLFKSRVLELLDIYIKQQYLNPLALDLLIPLLTVIRTTSCKQVSAKACHLIREYSKLYKLRDRLNSEVAFGPVTMEMLTTIHELATKEGSNAYSNACSQASILVAKIHIANDGDSAAVLRRYAETQLKFIHDADCHLRTSFFSDWLNWCTSARKALIAK